EGEEELGVEDRGLGVKPDASAADHHAGGTPFRATTGDAVGVGAEEPEEGGLVVGKSALDPGATLDPTADPAQLVPGAGDLPSGGEVEAGGAATGGEAGLFGLVEQFHPVEQVRAAGGSRAGGWPLSRAEADGGQEVLLGQECRQSGPVAEPAGRGGVEQE